ncbi:MAG: hypothetical protein FJ087_08670 [Deltaproteobacteria bacterium]|nr:hypothetical protein [Deltaproteobacteria bacterium]
MRNALRFAIVAAALAGACGAPAGDGSIRVFWEVGGERCEDLADVLKQVRVRVLDGAEDVMDPSPPTGCMQGGATRGFLVEDVPAGTWDVVVEGLGPTGVPWYEGRKENVRVRSGGETAVQTVLAMKPASIHATWYFQNGRGCADPANAVQSVDLAVYDVVTKAKLYPPDDPEDPGRKVLVDCKEVEALAEGIDANRDVRVNVFGLDADGKRKVFGTIQVRTEPGTRHEAAVRLDPCAGTACL